ncbi:3e469e0b-0b4a-4d98-90c5-0d329bbefc28 [Sclerotinia trifoliorum]|uniref:3e469e0b-0b4a-4d98-90c5-0d329bbefc28 n=1 Tax=Sclerotinia trifoliorum TaxID=28548 RepID=A0A8H2W3E6_9HELO|nr:3e469e0b-0b4a-4d98-90c5-0d329bbefc28 [Sclerotinia trifoliorum]
MASTTSTATTPAQTSTSYHDEASLPHHTKSAPNTTTSQSTEAEVSMPDGRRNSLGEPLQSSVETWKPNLVRNQSWNHQDLKRLHVEEGLKKEEWNNDEGVAGLGYSYENEENRKV